MATTQPAITLSLTTTPAVERSVATPATSAPSPALLEHLAAAYGSWAARSASAAYFALNRNVQADGADVERAWRTFSQLLIEAFPGLPFDERMAAFLRAADAHFATPATARRIDHPTVMGGPDLAAAECGRCHTALEWNSDEAEPGGMVAFCETAGCSQTYWARALAFSIEADAEGEGSEQTSVIP